MGLFPGVYKERGLVRIGWDRHRGCGSWPIIPRRVVAVVLACPQCLGHLLQSRFYRPIRRETDTFLVIAANDCVSLNLNLMGLVGRKPNRSSRRLVAGRDGLQVRSVRQERFYFPLGGSKPEVFHQLVGKVIATRRLVIAPKGQSKKEAHLTVIGITASTFR